MVAQFGVPLYGGTLVGQVVYQQGNAKGCDIFEKKLPATELPTILLVDRGGAPYSLMLLYQVTATCAWCCRRRPADALHNYIARCALTRVHALLGPQTATSLRRCEPPRCAWLAWYHLRVAKRYRGTLLQAYNAEKAGAKAIIVTDYKDERLLTMAAPEDRPEIAKLKDDITIPTALVQLVCLAPTVLLVVSVAACSVDDVLHTMQKASSRCILHVYLSAPVFTEGYSSLQSGRCLERCQAWTYRRGFTLLLLPQSVGQKLKDALSDGDKASVVVELDWKESVLHDSERWFHLLHAPCALSAL